NVSARPPPAALRTGRLRADKARDEPANPPRHPDRGVRDRASAAVPAWRRAVEAAAAPLVGGARSSRGYGDRRPGETSRLRPRARDGARLAARTGRAVRRAADSGGGGGEPPGSRGAPADLPARGAALRLAAERFAVAARPPRARLPSRHRHPASA